MSDDKEEQFLVEKPKAAVDDSNFKDMIENITKNKINASDEPSSMEEQRPSKALRQSGSMQGSMRHSYRVSFVGEHGLTTFTGVLAILSTIIGGGIVSIPYSFVSVGIPLGILLNIFAVIITMFSIDLYLAGKDLIPDKPESMYEIGYMVLERGSIFMVGVIQFINSFFLILLYFIVFGETAAQLFANMFNDGVRDVFYTERWFYVLIIATLMLPVILKKELAELEWCSWVLFGSIGLFIILNLWELTVDKNFQDEKSGLSFQSDVWVPNHGISRSLNALSVTMVAYSYQCNLFPIYTSLKEKNNTQYMKTNNFGLMLTCGIYIIVALISIAMFGENCGSVVLEDIGTARHNGKAFWEGYITQFSFLVLLACHIPFIFFAGKEGLLIMLDEWDRKSISNALFHKLYATNSAFEKENKDKMPPAPTLAIPGGEEKIMEFGTEEADPEQVRQSRTTAMASAKSRLSTMTTSETNRLAYKDMRTSLYLLGTFFFYILAIIGSIVIGSVSIVLDFAGAVAVSALAFGFPGLFYYKAAQRYGNPNPMYMKMAYIYMGFCVANFVLGMTSTILGILGDE